MYLGDVLGEEWLFIIINLIKKRVSSFDVNYVSFRNGSLPLTPLFLTKELGAKAPVAGLFYLTSIAGLLINLYTRHISDRMPSRIEGDLLNDSQ